MSPLHSASLVTSIFRGNGFAATGADAAGDSLGVAPQDIGDDNLGAFRRKQPRLGFAHAVSAASDDRNLVVQPHDCLPPFLSREHTHSGPVFAMRSLLPDHMLVAENPPSFIAR
jgi:hypothetical protein